MQLVFKVPTKETPGFLSRLHRATMLQQQVKEQGATPELVSSIVDFLADYVETENKEAACELLWQCSEAQFDNLMRAVSGGGAATETIPPQ